MKNVAGNTSIKRFFLRCANGFKLLLRRPMRFCLMLNCGLFIQDWPISMVSTELMKMPLCDDIWPSSRGCWPHIGSETLVQGDLKVQNDRSRPEGHLKVILKSLGHFNFI